MKKEMKTLKTEGLNYFECKGKIRRMCAAFIISMLISYSSFSQQCMISGATNAYSVNVCGTTYTVTGNIMLKTYINGSYFPCGGSVLVEMQKYNSATTNWITVASMVTSNNFYGLGIDPAWGPGQYRIYASNPSNNCNCYNSTAPYISSNMNVNTDAPPIFSVGQKYDATNSNNIPSTTTCNAPYSNICPGTYGYILTASNTSIPSNQISNGQWSCTLEEVSLNGCASTPALVFNKLYTNISSMASLGNINLNSYATTYGGKPANYLNNNNKKWKFTLNIRYSCNNIYTYTCWLRYSNAGCRMINSEFSDEALETLSDNTLILFPNPTNSNVEIKTDEKITSITVYDINGKESKIESINNKIDLSNFKSGIYTLKIYTENGISTKKVIKQD